METKFQTSFIPKKPMVPVSGGVIGTSHHHVSIFMTIAVFIFIISLAGLAGAYAWEYYLTVSQASYKTQLATREQQFNIDLIQQLKTANVKIDSAKQLLQAHTALSQIFDVISKLTVENVRFTDLDVTLPAQSGSDLNISLSGYGADLPSVAFQSDVLGNLEHYGLRDIVKNPIMANPALDTSGKVSFSFAAVIDPSDLSYEKAITQPTTAASSSGSSN